MLGQVLAGTVTRAVAQALVHTLPLFALRNQEHPPSREAAHACARLVSLLPGDFV